MTISRDYLRALGRSHLGQRVASFSEATRFGMQTAFLCHSHKDAEFVKGFVELLKREGIDLYVDWEDLDLPETPNQTTALKLQKRICDARYFLFLATPNSVTSRWCPWEIGYANGIKPIERILVVPTTDASNNITGNEYLGPYRRIDTLGQSLQFYEPGSFAGESLKRL